jgi:hypothetical protein
MVRCAVRLPLGVLLSGAAFLSATLVCGISRSHSDGVTHEVIPLPQPIMAFSDNTNLSDATA